MEDQRLTRVRALEGPFVGGNWTCCSGRGRRASGGHCLLGTRVSPPGWRALRHSSMLSSILIGFIKARSLCVYVPGFHMSLASGTRADSTFSPTSPKWPFFPWAAPLLAGCPSRLSGSQDVQAVPGSPQPALPDLWQVRDFIPFLSLGADAIGAQRVEVRGWRERRVLGGSSGPGREWLDTSHSPHLGPQMAPLAQNRPHLDLCSGSCPICQKVTHSQRH